MTLKPYTGCRPNILTVSKMAVLAVILASCSGRDAEKARRDSIRMADSLAFVQAQAAAAQEEADSIARRNFTTPDLAFNQLHGDVKEASNPSPYEYENNVKIFKYDEDGNWLNVPEWTSEDKKWLKECNKPSHKTTRDSEGRISRMYGSCEIIYDYIGYTWNDGRVTKDSYGRYHYSDDGLLIAYFEDDYDIQENRTIFTDYVVDYMGNWIERTAHTYTYEPVNEYNDQVPVVKETEKQKRTITYYKSNGGGRIEIPDTDKQKQLLASEKKRWAKAQEFEKAWRETF